jgi:hypothetical protein
MPVTVSLVISQAPSLLQAHKAEELSLILWGGWCIGMLGGVASAYRTHLSWKRGTDIRPTDVVCLELLFVAVMLGLFPFFRSGNIVALIAGMLAMSSVVIELGRSRIPHHALSPASVRARDHAYQKGRKPPMGLGAAAALARHNVLIDILFSFVVVLVCFASSSVYSWAHTKSYDDDELSALPDFSPCFILTGVLALVAALHFFMVRYQEFKAKNEDGSDPAVSSAGNGVTSNPNKGSDADDSDGEETKVPGKRKKLSAQRESLNIIKGKWLALQSAFSLGCLYGGRLLAGSLFGSFYTHLPAYQFGSSSVGTEGEDGERDAAVIANVVLWASASIGALLSTQLVSNWSAGKKSHFNDLALTRISLVALTGTAAPALFMLATSNRVVAWMMLSTYGGFNGFASVLSLAIYTRRLPVLQATRISIIKSVANVGSGLIPLLASISWASGYNPSSGATLHAAFMLTMALTGLLPLTSLGFLFRRQSQEPYADPILTPPAKFSGVGESSMQMDFGSDSDEEMDLESYFMDYRLRQMQEKLTAASKDIEANLEDDDEGDIDEEDDVFGETSALITA